MRRFVIIWIICISVISKTLGDIPSTCNISGNVLNCNNRKLCAFPNLSDLDLAINVLDFSDNGISQISHVSVPTDNNVSVLLLSGNRISHIQEAAFSSLKRIQILDLSRNRLSENETLASKFSGLENLRHLNLSINPIIHLVDIAQAFIRSQCLSNLYLSECQLDIVDAPALFDLQALSVLDLSHNHLRDINHWNFWRLNSLGTLDLSFNHLLHINSSSFGTLESLTYLNLSHNFISYLPGDAFISLPNLRQLDLSANNFSDIPSGSLALAKSLINLDLSDNPIKVIHAIPRPVEGVVINAQSLRLNNMSQLTDITVLGFQLFLKLQDIKITNNQRLSVIESEAFSLNFKTIKNVYIENNNISTISEYLLPWNNLKMLRLGSNPWNCDQALCWMIEKKDVLSKFDLSITCVSPQNLYGRNVLSLSPRDMNCSSVKPSSYSASASGEETEILVTFFAVLSLIGSSVVIMCLIKRRRRIVQ